MARELPAELLRRTPFLTHPVFHSHRSESALMRYIRGLERKDIGLDTSMIPLGSCTMKLNAAAEMLPLSWPELARIHPFAPAVQAAGYHQLFGELEGALGAITGLPGVSLQPNSGAQGELAGLLVIQAWHRDRGQGRRNIALIPQSAHGTNPASAAMAGMQVVVVACDDKGNIDVADLEAKARQHADRLAALLVTYPSTHGVFEDAIQEICRIVHAHGGQVYMDGANMNAQVGLTSPAIIGADVCHINLHKTFAIPHGGGGPGMGPICVAAHLAPYLPGHPVVKTGGAKAIHAVSAAPWGSASILAISYGYIAMLGRDGLRDATAVAILNANYVKARLEPHFPILYTRTTGRVAHEMIVDLRPLKAASGIDETDVAKRLMDYGFHAPTVSFPVAGTLMIEPTESEPKAELDRFCDALIAIRGEIQAVIDGKADTPGQRPEARAAHRGRGHRRRPGRTPTRASRRVYPLPFVRGAQVLAERRPHRQRPRRPPAGVRLSADVRLRVASRRFRTQPGRRARRARRSTLESPGRAGAAVLYRRTPDGCAPPCATCQQERRHGPYDRRRGADVVRQALEPRRRGDDRSAAACRTASSTGCRRPTGQSLRGPIEFKPFYQAFRNAFPDISIELVHVVVQGELGIGHCRVTGTQRGDLPDLPATHHRIDIDRLRHGAGRRRAGTGVVELLRLPDHVPSARGRLRPSPVARRGRLGPPVDSAGSAVAE